MHNFFKVWASVVISLSYCYTVGKLVPKGLWRLALMLPVVSLFLLIPLGIDSVNLGGLTSFFVAWLANFKLLLFAFGKGPLAIDESSGSLLRFVVIACLPIKVQRSLAQNVGTEKGHGVEKRSKGHKSPLNYAVKGALVLAMVRVYDFSDIIHPTVIYLLYCFHIYFALEIILASLAAAVRAAFGMDLEPQFNEPYLATSLQDFWSRRWNLIVPSILRPSVYEPVRDAAARLTGRSWAPVPAILAVFLVSGLMHELMFYHLQRTTAQRTAPPWDLTWFFVLHGVCLVAEIVVKKALAGKYQLPRPLSGALTCVFVIVTGLRWFLLPMLRMEVDKRGLEEYAAVAAFVRDTARTVSDNFHNIVKG